MLRRQLPVHSALTLRALLGAAVGALGLDLRRALGRRIRAYWGAQDVLLSGSGTVALTLALRSALREREAAVALPAYGCYDLATAAVGADARVVLYDLDPDTLAPDPASLQRALDRGPAALVLVHLYGLPVDVVTQARQAAESGALIIEDAAQGLGALVRGQPAGSLGSVSVLSFGRGKGLTGGAGGALLANDDRGARAVDYARSLMHGSSAGWSELARSAAQWVLGRPGLYGLPAALPFLRLGQTVYRPPEQPHELSRAAASMIFRNWKPALSAVARRRATAARLIAAARAGGAWQPPRLDPEGLAGYLRLPMLAHADARDLVNGRPAARLGIMHGYPMPLVQLPGFAERCINSQEPLPGATLLAERLFTLPTHELLTERDITALQRWLTQPDAQRLATPTSRQTAVHSTRS